MVIGEELTLGAEVEGEGDDGTLEDNVLVLVLEVGKDEEGREDEDDAIGDWVENEEDTIGRDGGETRHSPYLHLTTKFDIYE